MAWESLIEAARQGRGPLKHARTARRFFRGLRLPVIRPLVALVSTLALAVRLLLLYLLRFFVREPYFRYRCERVGVRLNLQGRIPQILGNGRIEIGDDVTIGNHCTWDLAYSIAGRPELIIGDRVSVNYRCTLSIARSLSIGSDTMIAGNVKIYDNISHPISPARRLTHSRINADETTPVVIGQNCWIGVGSIILRGVTIGDNSIVAAGSVVTKSVPPNTLVAGNPAVAVKTIVDDTTPRPAPAPAASREPAVRDQDSQ
jgi:acetyltransferase-like isoleucine patch superfamily enzyme